MRIKSMVSHAAVGCAAAVATLWIITGQGPQAVSPAAAQAQGQRSTELFNQVMDDVLGRRFTVRLTEREDPGSGGAAHRRSGSHTVGYILEGSYEVKIDEASPPAQAGRGVLRGAERAACDFGNPSATEGSNTWSSRCPIRASRRPCRSLKR